jgi:hypothetical protein
LSRSLEGLHDNRLAGEKFHRENFRPPGFQPCVGGLGWHDRPDGIGKETFRLSSGAASIGLALGFWIAIVPMLLIVPFMVRRTLIEERMLASALPRYWDYMRQVRSRIVPGVW